SRITVAPEAAAMILPQPMVARPTVRRRPRRVSKVYKNHGSGPARFRRLRKAVRDVLPVLTNDFFWVAVGCKLPLDWSILCRSGLEQSPEGTPAVDACYTPQGTRGFFKCRPAVGLEARPFCPYNSWVTGIGWWNRAGGGVQCLIVP